MLTKLYLYTNPGLTGPLPYQLGRLSNLKELWINHCAIEGPLPDSLGNLSSLTHCYLNNNNITGEIPAVLGNLSNLTVINLDKNLLTGTIPYQLGRCTKLNRLYLSDNQLSGTIPDSLGNLSNLTFLHLYSNNLTGSIPSSLGNLVNLQELRLSWNSLEGSIPSSLGNLSNLTALTLQQNNLSGALPSSFGGLSSLTGLNANANNLSGTVPSELGNLSQLQGFNIENNRFTDIGEGIVSLSPTFIELGNNRFCNLSSTVEAWATTYDPDWNTTQDCFPDSLALIALYDSTNGDSWTNNTNWKTTNPIDTWYGVVIRYGRVVELNLAANNLVGTIPSEIGNLTLLEIIRFESNNLTGVIPSSLGNLKKLYHFIASENQLTGTIPAELGNMNTCTMLMLNGNLLSGSIPMELGRLSNLGTLRLEGNQLTGSIPDSLGNLSNLQWLHLGVNQLSGTIPSSLGNLTALTKLQLYTNSGLIGPIPYQLGRLSNLNELWINHCAIEGPLPDSLGNLSSLSYLYLNNNRITGTIPTTFGNLSNLVEIRLDHNLLTGSIPYQLGRCTKLRRLYLSDNQLNGVIPDSLGNLTNLTYLYLYYNDLTGSIPSSLGNLINLQNLDLVGNNLEGSIPSSLGSLSNLIRFYLNNNNLSGSLPTSLGGLTNVEAINVGYNNLSGTIPSELGALPQLQGLYIQNNQFTDIAEGIVNLSLTYTDLGNNRFCNLLPTVETWATTYDPDWQLTQEGCSRTSDSLALVALYNSTNGHNWTNNTNWMSSSSIDTWYGVTVKNDRVTKISLIDNGLYGKIPVELGNLSSLDSLRLNDNSLYDTIPSELGNLSALIELILTSNDLSGTIPPSLGNLLQLKNLNLNYNDSISGSIPLSLGNLTNLVYLQLAENNLSGSIPDTLGNLSNLKQLLIPHNNLSGPLPSRLGDLINLESIRLHGNNLSGSIPLSLGKLTNLQYIDLYENQLTGSIPDTLGNLTSLIRLRLDDNQLSGSIPSALGRLSNLYYLYLNHNALSGSIPVSLGGLTYLSELILSTNNLTGTVPDSLGSLSNLQKLYLQYNQLSDIGDSLIKLTNLAVLNAGYNSICSPSPAVETWLNTYDPDWNLTQEGCSRMSDSLALVALYDSTDGPHWTRITWNLSDPLELWGGVTITNNRVTELRVDRCDLNGTIPDEIGDLTELTVIDLHSNSALGGTIPSTIGNLTKLTNINCYLCSISGSIPASIGNCTSLTNLNLSETELTGSIPVEIGNLTQLTSLNLRDKDNHGPGLTGPIPSSIGNLANLEHINLGYNELSGSIPDAIGNCTSLLYIYFEENHLSGSIPDTLGNLSNLRRLYLFHNFDLSGLIPSRLGDLTLLNELKISNTKISGILPNELGNLSNLTTLIVSTNQLTDIGDSLVKLTGLTNLNIGNNKICNLSIDLQNWANTYDPDWQSSQDCSERVNDSLALVALYDSTNGSNWTNSINWKTINPIDTWYGVTTESNRVRKIVLGSNNLNGTLPPEIGNCSNLDTLILNTNSLSGTIPSELGRLSHLEYLNLCVNQLSGTIPDSLQNLTSLMGIALDNNNLSGAIPSWFGNLSNLQALVLHRNSFSDTIPSSLGNLTNLTNLGLHINSLTGAIPVSLGNLTELKYLMLYSNNLSGTIPDTLGNLRKLKYLYIHNNNLSGSLPSSLGNIDSLEILYASNNSLSGSIPVSMGGLKKLIQVYLNDNNLSGLLPDSLGSLSNLTTLHLHDNQALSGSIPQNFGNLSNLRYLYLGNNDLSGIIPASLGGLRKLEELGLYNNNFSGTIPDSLGFISTLKKLNFNNNQFTDIGDSLVKLTNLTMLNAGYNSICSPSSAVETWLNTYDPDWNLTQEGCSRMSDSLALVALYDSTDGANWTNNTNWKTSNPIDTWYGITINNNRVTKIELGQNGLNGTIPAELGNLSLLDSLYLFHNNLYDTIPSELGNLSNLRELILSGNQLTGSIPSSLGMLSNLCQLYLNENNLSGTIPLSLGNLTHLERLILQENNLTGTIPDTLANLSNLKRLSLAWNDLTGTIPSRLGELSNLEYLILHTNNLSGSLPLSLGNLTNLMYLDINNNQFTGIIPDTLRNLSSIHRIKVSWNQLSGTIPGWLGGLTNLYELYLNGNSFTGTAPDSLGYLTNLTTLELRYNQLTDIGDSLVKLNNLTLLSVDHNSICLPSPGVETWLNTYDPDWNLTQEGCSRMSDSLALVALYDSTDGPNWTNNTNWKTSSPIDTWHGITLYNNRVINLSLIGNNLNGVLPSELGDLSKLQQLRLDTNSISGTIPVEIGQLSELEEIYISRNNLTGQIPSAFGGLQNLKTMRLSHNQLSDSIPAQLGNITTLQLLDLSFNQLSGSIPLELGNLLNLQELHFQYNQLSGTIPPELGNLENLIVLSFYRNNITSIIPIEIGNLSNLLALNLSNNQLYGAIPIELGNLSKLRFIDIGFNDLTDSIPSELSNLSNLEQLYLSHNSLTGSIPSGLGNLSKLQRLNFYNNQLTGTIPLELANLSNLQRLELSYNSLTGPIPSCIGNLSNLESIGLANNQLSGSIPPSLGNLSNLTILSLYNNQLTGFIPPELGNLKKLFGILAGNNKLSGSIPPELGSIDSAVGFDFSNNELTGTIPSELASLQELYTLYLDNNNFTGIGDSLVHLIITRPDGLNLGYNSLCNLSPDVKQWADMYDPDWQSTQIGCDEPPVPTAAVLDTLFGECEVVVTTIPTAVSYFGDTIYGTTTDSLNYTAQGSFQILWTYTDTLGNDTTQTQMVIVQDMSAPIPDSAELPVVSGEDSVEVTIIPTATDNCSGVIQATTSDSLIYRQPGTYQITWRFNDGNGNDTTQLQTVHVMPGYRFSASVDPSEAVGSIGATIEMKIVVVNTGTRTDAFTYTISGLDTSWYSATPDTLTCIPGAVGEALLQITTESCAAAGLHPYTVVVRSLGNGTDTTLSAAVELKASPVITNLSPENNTTIGATSVLFSWTTDDTASGAVFLKESGAVLYTEYSGAASNQHRITVDGLNRNTSYEWYAQSQSSCGTTTSAVCTLSIGNGIVFTQKTYDFSIDRDYNQLRTVGVRNDDIIPHTVQLSIASPSQELIIGFIGEGSEDSVITLEPGETRNITLAIHAQDAAPNATYPCVAHLVADADSSEPITDNAAVNVLVFVPALDYTLEQIGYDSISQMRTFRITNSPSSEVALTDVAVSYEILSGKGAVFIDPQINHALLGIGQSLDFNVYPFVDAAVNSMSVRIVATAATMERSVTFDAGCFGDNDYFTGRVHNVMFRSSNADWYCTNRPRIEFPIDLPAGVMQLHSSDAQLEVNIMKMWNVVTPHTAEFYVNGHLVGGYYNVVPQNVYVFPVDPSSLSQTHDGVSRNTIQIISSHMNGGHYTVTTDISLMVCLDEYSEKVCALSQEEADWIVYNRTYIVPTAQTLSVQILSPASGITVKVDSLVQVTAQVTDDLGLDRPYTVVCLVNNGVIGGMLYDDGLHEDQYAGDGIYGNLIPVNTVGQSRLSVRSWNCATSGVDSIVVYGVSAPDAVDDTVTTLEDESVSLDVLANDTDLDGDSLAVVSVTAGAHGSATIHGSAVLYTPALNFYGTDAFQYVVGDDDGYSDTATVTVTVISVNDGGPVAARDTAVTDQEKAVTISVLSNDTDIDGDVLTLVSVSQPAHGAAAISGAQVTYTPAVGYYGDDAFTYIVSDGNGGIDTGDVVVTVMRDTLAPVPDQIPLDTVRGDCAVQISAAPTATDNCAGTVVATTTDPLSYTQAGVYLIVWLYDDGHGNSITQLQTVVVSDTDAPVPVTVLLDTLRGQCAVQVTAVPTAVDACAGIVSGTTADSLTYTQQGIYQILWTYTDGNGNGGTQPQVVIVNDTEAPVVNVATLDTVAGACFAEVTIIPTAMDACAGLIHGTTTDPLTYTTPGTYQISWVYTDGHGNSTTQPQVVVVNDTDAPVADSTTLDTLRGQCVVEVTAIPTATDACAGIVTGTTTDPLLYTQQGIYQITWVYDDGHGNSATQSQAVVVSDTDAPVVDAAILDTVSGQCSATVTTTPTATDACAGVILGTTTDSLTYTAQGTYQILWTYDDGNGNVSSQSQVVVVADTEAPVVDNAILDTLIGQCMVEVLNPPTATDACAGVIVGATTDSLIYTQQGTYLITWTYDDGNGNSVTQPQVVIVNDTTAPVADIASLDTLIGTCAVVITTAPTAVDACAGILTGTTADPLTYTEPGMYQLAWIYDDGNGNSITQQQTVIVENAVPNLDSIGSKSVDEESALEFVVDASDNCGDSLILSMSGTVPATATFIDSGNGRGKFLWQTTYEDSGVYEAVFTVSDGYWEVTEAISIVVNNVNRAPIAVGGEDHTAHPGDVVTLSAIQSSDPDGDYPLSYLWTLVSTPEGSSSQLENSYEVSATVALDMLGEYIVELIVIDALGMQSAPDLVYISTINSAPIAAAGSDQVVYQPGDTVVLDGSQSEDSDGDSISYSWTMVARPQGSAAVLDDTYEISPFFIPDVYGDYFIALVVSDPWISSDPDTVLVSFENIAPIAVAGNNQTVVVMDTVYLDASGSSDANGDSLRYQWQIVALPESSVVVLSNDTAVQTQFIPDRAGQYVVSLLVGDGLLSSNPDQVSIVAVSIEDTLTQTIDSTIETINTFPQEVFKKKRMDQSMTLKLTIVQSLIEKGNYHSAHNILSKQVKRSVDGCAEGGSPDSNDWIVDCDAQSEVYLLIQEAIAYLEQLLNQ